MGNKILLIFVTVFVMFLQVFSDDIPDMPPENKAVYGFKEKEFNWRLNPSTGGVDVSSRISLYRNHNFASGIIIGYSLSINQEPDTFNSDTFDYTYTAPGPNDPEYALFYINYKF
jgi:hypothetical protein